MSDMSFSRVPCLEGVRRSRAFPPARAACPEYPKCPICPIRPLCSDMSHYWCYVLIAPFVLVCPVCSDMSDLSVMRQSVVRPDNGQRGPRPICEVCPKGTAMSDLGGYGGYRPIRHLWVDCPVMSGLSLSSRFFPYVRFDRGSAEVGRRGYPYLCAQIIPVITSNYQ